MWRPTTSPTSTLVLIEYPLPIAFVSADLVCSCVPNRSLKTAQRRPPRGKRVGPRRKPGPNPRLSNPVKDASRETAARTAISERRRVRLAHPKEGGLPPLGGRGTLARQSMSPPSRRSTGASWTHPTCEGNQQRHGQQERYVGSQRKSNLPPHTERALSLLESAVVVGFGVVLGFVQ